MMKSVFQVFLKQTSSNKGKKCCDLVVLKVLLKKNYLQLVVKLVILTVILVQVFGIEKMMPIRYASNSNVPPKLKWLFLKY